MSVDQMKSRLAFIGLDARQQATISSIQPIVKRLIGGALDRFYTRAHEESKAARFFRDAEHMKAAKSAQEAHWMRLTSGQFDQEFYASVRRIGAVHARIGLEPRWYVGAYALVLEELIAGIGQHCSPWRRMLNFFRTPATTEASIAIVKAALLESPNGNYGPPISYGHMPSIDVGTHGCCAARPSLPSDISGMGRVAQSRRGLPIRGGR